METIKIAFKDFWPEWDIEDFISPILKSHFNVIIDNKNPDVLFHSIFNGMRSTPTYKCKKVLILAENWRASQFKSDYSISFDPHSPSNYRLPLWQMYLLLKPELKNLLFNKIRHQSFDRFCAFIVSNPSNFFRIGAFEQLNAYKKVHSYGKVKMNSTELKKASENRYWRDAKFDFFSNSKHKFMMCFENSSYPYYCTEKIMDAFLGGCIPIYWGCPKVDQDWNSGAFINAMRSNWIDRVKLIDNNIEEFNRVYDEPIFTDEQKQRHLDNIGNFESWLIEIIKK